ncbi:MAG: hypothetical protein ACREIR_21285 [Geminicoccaceae bacterium]
MRAIVIFAAVLAAMAMAPQPAEAGDRGVGFRHFSPPAGAKFHRPHHGLKFAHRGFVGKHPQFKPRHLHHFRHGGLVLKFGAGDFVLKFGHVRRFGQKHGHMGSFFRFDRPRHVRLWRDRGFALKDRHGLPEHPRPFRHSVPRLKDDHLGGMNGAALPEALLKELEHLRFRHLPELLSETSR